MELRILGPVEIWTDDDRNSLDGSKQRTVLAALLLARQRMISDHQLSALLWGADPPATMNAQIYTYISRLRKLLGDGASIVRQRPGYLLRIGTARFDFADFERHTRLGRAALKEQRYADAAGHFRAGLTLWRGPALTDVTEFLADVELPRLEEARMAALESRIEADLALGRHTQLVAELTGLVAAYPLAERLRAQLMLALFRSDRQADALAVYQTGRRILADELGVDPGPALSKAQWEVLAGEVPAAPAAEPRGVGGWTRPRPAMLPADIADFSGRPAEVEQLRGLLGHGRPDGAGRPAVAVVHGMPGVGKSALAVHALHGRVDDFPDGQLYADLGGSTGRPAAPADVLAGFLAALGVLPAAIPADEAGRVQLYRSQLASRRVLVLLDDAVDGRQVRSLLPGGAACAVVVTSRSRLSTLAGVRALRLDPLPTPAAEELVRAAVGAERVAGHGCALHRLVQLCGGLPLALRAVTARLLSRPHWPLARLADRMADDERTLDELRLGEIDVRSSLETGYRGLSEPAGAALRRLALLDVDALPAWVSAAVLGVAEERGEDATAELVEANLLDIDVTAGGPRYRIHPLVRRFARERALADDPPAERAASVDRALGAWLWLAGEADRRLPDREAPTERRPRLATGVTARWRIGARLAKAVGAAPLDWFVAESPTLRDLVRQAAAAGRPHAAWEIAHASANFFEIGGRYEEWHGTHQRALTAVRAGGDEFGEAVVLLGLARLSASLDDVGARLTYADRAARLFRAAGDHGREAEALAHVGAAYRLTGHFERADGHLARAVELAASAGDPGARAVTHKAVGDLLFDQERLPAAAEEYAHALCLWRGLGHRRHVAAVSRRLGKVERERGQYDEAAVRFGEAAGLATAMGDRALAAAVQVGQGQLAQSAGQANAARQAFTQAIRAFDTLGLARRSGHAAALQGLGELALAEGRVAAAGQMLADAADVWRCLAMPLRQARALAALGDAQVASGHFEDAVATWQAVSDLSERAVVADSHTL
ncbi:BTAD domain-containing putative transcriptional regulator [Phytohabitans sp. ZYX-F-186]|uniref:BTAD domain-containing putative transcriptional regulator n=1 Tax=Phytohabitans maris TaxID=3071409 RepID=A0ABU0Z9A1_9ACTN|nr:BTAD domain-containing putative transcriptional regulator [Phytohabitans sp. ZYX-F-186]MDQ7903627.1 BTAD domain-containing putative transcriptional regulator [Phytohabitans sp. ZYX-F-186]